MYISVWPTFCYQAIVCEFHKEQQINIVIMWIGSIGFQVIGNLCNVHDLLF